MNDIVIKIAAKLIKPSEGCNLSAYPDPGSPLYKALSIHGMLHKYMAGTLKWKDLDKNFQALSGSPWTCGYGETNGVTKDTVWTQAECDTKLAYRIGVVMTQCIKDCPRLGTLSQERQAAITSLAYNIGAHAFATSTACKLIKAGDDAHVGEAIKRFNKDSGQLSHGLVARRQIETNLWNSVKG